MCLYLCYRTRGFSSLIFNFGWKCGKYKQFRWLGLPTFMKYSFSCVDNVYWPSKLDIAGERDSMKVNQTGKSLLFEPRQPCWDVWFSTLEKICILAFCYILVLMWFFCQNFVGTLIHLQYFYNPPTLDLDLRCVLMLRFLRRKVFPNNFCWDLVPTKIVNLGQYLG